MLWKIIDTPHRLLGSVHVLSETAVLPRWVAASYDGIERFVFEADNVPNDVGVDRTGAHLTLHGASEIYQRAKIFLASIGSNDPFDALRPWRAAFYFSGKIYPPIGISSARGIESRFRVIANTNGIPLDFLESPTHSFELTDLSCKKAAGGLAFFEHVVSLFESGVGVVEVQRIMRAWLTCDLKDLTVILNEMSIKFPFMFEPIITQRNREWVSVAKKLASETVPTLFVVGCLHTIGQDNFIQQLEREGFQFKQMSSN